MRIKLSCPLTLYEIAKSVGGILNTEDRKIEYVTTDSREAVKDDLFIALKGERFDGEDFVEDVAARGVHILSSNSKMASVTVDDTLQALAYLASFYKNNKLKNLKHTVAITGSVGKTTTKELVGALLSRKYKVHATKSNFNNRIGAPITILSAPESTEILVLELGMNEPGEILKMTEMATPDIAVITNVGHAHIGKLGTRELIARAKLEICESANDKLVTLVPYGESLLESARGRLTVSLENRNCDFFLFPLLQRENHSIFDFYSKNCVLISQDFKIGGRHILASLVYAIGVASLCGINANEIAEGINRISAEILRQRFIEIGNFKIFDDTYSSSPEAVNAVISYLSLIHDVEKSAVLGDMLELGESTERLHRKIGADVYRSGFSKLYAYGVYAPFIASGARSAGMNPENIFVNTDLLSPQTTAEQIKHSYNGELLLFKASHSLNASKIYDYLK